MDTKERRKHLKPVGGRPSQGKRPVRKERKLRDADVVYTPPKPFKRGKFVLSLVTVVAVVMAIVLGMSIFFKVENIKVSGCQKYEPWEVSEASGVEKGANLLTISRAQIGGNVLSNLPYVDKVRVGIILPDTVNIEITEQDVVYSIEDVVGNWWLMTSDGKIVEQINSIRAKQYTQVLGVRLQEPVIGQLAVAQEAELTTIPITDGTTEEGETEGTTEPATTDATTPTLAVGVTGAQRLQTAISVLQVLGNNSICGQIDSVDVSKLNSIELWYDERFQITLGDTVQLEYKVSTLRATIERMESYESGHLDVSFTNWPDKVGYTPFT
jgi:cell division protein FtsQ